MRVKLTIAYDGTNYVGWQSQVNGIAIQDVVNQALSGLFGTEMKTIGASRTDTGVHAEGNVAVFDVETRIEVSKIAFALNARLPEDIRIVESKQVPDDFHPRFQKTVKTYEYHILNRTFPDPLLRLYAMHYYYPLDAGKMNEAAAFLVGEHDFASFCASGFSGKTTVRTIYRADVRREDDLIIFTIVGNGFLYNMVRIISGTLIQVGSGEIQPGEMKQILEARDRSAAGPTAIPKGLVLKKIEYPEAEE
ncbi:MAG: tRNA pseudouridine(38-40) synthase TruA [Lachnospiraceae bacterium]|jgi:tRNA pseudouridine38-40 synthase|nr:tRNA pseudouridine(38-40) synthase TruA [Lachnospiraceae bacterium]MCI1727199.1 tRNA pseudouridine(38-40) synthase TruA [Lachnospiraceae bacterium]